MYLSNYQITSTPSPYDLNVYFQGNQESNQTALFARSEQMETQDLFYVFHKELEDLNLKLMVYMGGLFKGESAYFKMNKLSWPTLDSFTRHDNSLMKVI